MNESKLPYGKISGPEQLGSLIRQERKGQGITQEDLSALAGVGPRLIGEIERGKPTAEIGKVFQLLSSLGLVLSIQSRTSKDWRE
ncbi:type II toxin-antitoxin system Y4mF family antitoxin [Desulfuromonas sp. CSMB_57]|uniref:type II toxin-antitoxin system Y4mF family antitoxin n=1 Tax=Desulfuromonas sp. CSMB_57 TaxID=2807629 RepID=UPI001CD6EEB2|nr:type II toxin-antitoxin system Y4mF family antitoxin [Desulfuromonas sp. CSMB_57]